MLLSRWVGECMMRLGDCSPAFLLDLASHAPVLMIRLARLIQMGASVDMLLVLGYDWGVGVGVS